MLFQKDYLTSFLKTSSEPSYFNWLLIVGLFGTAIGTFLSGILYKHLSSNKPVILLGASAVTLCHILFYLNSSYFYYLIIVFILSTSSGMVFVSSLKNLWFFFPAYKSFITSLVLSVNSVFLLSLHFLSTQLINPDNIQPINGTFPKEVVDNYSTYFIYLFVISLVTQLGSMLTLYEKAPFEEKLFFVSDSSKSLIVIEKETTHYLLGNEYVLIVTAACLNSFLPFCIICTIGQMAKISNKDIFSITWVFLLALTLMQLFWGLLTIKVFYKQLIVVFSITSAVVGVIAILTVTELVSIFFLTVANTVITAAIQVLYLNLLLKMYGEKNVAEMYGVLLMSLCLIFSVSLLSLSELDKNVLSVVFAVGSACSLGAIGAMWNVLEVTFKEPNTPN